MHGLKDVSRDLLHSKGLLASIDLASVVLFDYIEVPVADVTFSLDSAVRLADHSLCVVNLTRALLG